MLEVVEKKGRAKAWQRERAEKDNAEEPRLGRGKRRTQRVADKRVRGEALGPYGLGEDSVENSRPMIGIF